MEKVNEEKLKRELAFDQYGRHDFIRKIINLQRSGDQKFKILDIGGRGNILRRFLSKDEVYYLDPFVDTSDDNYIEGDGCAIPLEDNSFDFVVSVDVFEHIPSEKRNDFVNESIRVSRKGALLLAPFYNNEINRAEDYLNTQYKKLSGNEHVWLKEHLSNGLPKEDELEVFLKNKKKSFKKYGNNNLYLWEILTRINLLVAENFHEKVQEKFGEFNDYYNSEIASKDYVLDNSYRKIYWIKKEKDLVDFLPLEKEITTIEIFNTVEKAMELIEVINKEDRKIMNERLVELSTEIPFNENNTDVQLKRKIVDLRVEKMKLLKKIEGLRTSLEQKNAEIEWMKSSKFWKMRNANEKFKKVPRFVKIAAQKGLLAHKRGGVKGVVKSGYNFLKYRDSRRFHLLDTAGIYYNWIQNNENFDIKAIFDEMDTFKLNPKFSIIMPVYNVPAKWLDKCIQSVVDQYYENWELCIFDDCSTSKDTLASLKKWEEKKDKRIKIGYGKKNQHISGASNDAIKLATGDFIVLLDNDDEISHNALYEYAKAINDNPEVDMIYSDEDKISEKNERFDPFFKPDWAPELFLSAMYTCHLGAYRKSIIDEIGGFRLGYEGSQDYDLVLRFIEKTKPENIAHVARVLYHWRTLKTSTALGAGSKMYAFEAAKKAIQDYLDRNKIKGKVVDARAHGFYRVIRDIKEEKLVSIIIPFKDQAKVLERCIESIFEKTDYKNYEIILVDNNSEEKATFEYLEGIKSHKRITLLKYEKPFNYSAINNFAVEKAKGEYVLLLNNDTEVINDGWLRAMVEQIQRPEVGAVGAMLYYPNDTVQHAGVIIGMGGTAGHIYKGYKRGSMGYVGQLICLKEYNAVTAACMLTRKEVYREVGGLDEVNLKIAFNDVDFCLKVREKGYKVMFTPYAELYHYESLSRGYDNELEHTNPEKFKRVVAEIEFFGKKWTKYIEHDEFYNPNFTLGNNDGKISPETVQQPNTF